MKEKEVEKKRSWWSRHWGKVFIGSLPVCMVIGAMWFGKEGEDPWFYAIMFGPMLWVAIWMLWVLVWMTIHFNDKSSSDSGNFHISAPSKQTQRMLKRNIRRRWF